MVLRIDEPNSLLLNEEFQRVRAPDLMVQVPGAAKAEKLGVLLARATVPVSLAGASVVDGVLFLTLTDGTVLQGVPLEQPDVTALGNLVVALAARVSALEAGQGPGPGPGGSYYVDENGNSYVDENGNRYTP